jgi:hypothetical protein
MAGRTRGTSTRTITYSGNRRQKYNSTVTRDEVSGKKFHSKAEYEEYGNLLWRFAADEIRDLETQVRFHIMVNKNRICVYVADFTYLEKQGDEWKPVIHDKKGYKTEVFKLKWKLMEALYGDKWELRLT